MAKNKTVTHLPPPAAPRLAAQLFTVMGELVMIAISVVGILTIVGWIMAGAELRVSEHVPRRPHLQPTVWRCWIDPRYGEMCEPADRPPPARRHYVSGSY